MKKSNGKFGNLFFDVGRKKKRAGPVSVLPAVAVRYWLRRSLFLRRFMPDEEGA